MAQNAKTKRTLKDVRRETLAVVLGVACGWVTKIFYPEVVDDMPLNGGFNFLLICGIPLAVAFYFIERKRILNAEYPSRSDTRD